MVHGVCENKCMKPVYTSEEVDAMISGIVYKDIPAGTNIAKIAVDGWYRGNGSEVTGTPTAVPFVMLVTSVSDTKFQQMIIPHNASILENAESAVYIGSYDVETDLHSPWQNIDHVELTLDGTVLQLETRAATIVSEIDLSPILPGTDWIESGNSSSGETTTKMNESIQWLMLYARSRYAFTTTKSVYVKLWDNSNNVLWTSETIAANSKIYIDYDNASGIATIHAGTERDFMPFVESFSFAGGYGSLKIGIETTDGSAFGKGNATSTNYYYG